MKTVIKLWFANDRIFTDEQRSQWTESHFGLHWENIDEDISFESFTWADNDPLTLYHCVF